jgi:hypothetical protein
MEESTSDWPLSGDRRNQMSVWTALGSRAGIASHASLWAGPKGQERNKRRIVVGRI